MARGGSRQGALGVAHPQRSDLNKAKIATFTGQTYGTQAAQVAQQQAAPPPAAPVVPGPPQRPSVPQGFTPRSVSLQSPSQRPNEPVTAGLASGPGAGPAALGGPPAGSDMVARMQALYQAAPSPSMWRLVLLAEQEQAQGPNAR